MFHHRLVLRACFYKINCFGYSCVMERYFPSSFLGRMFCCLYYGQKSQAWSKRFSSTAVQLIHSKIMLYIRILQCEEIEAGYVIVFFLFYLFNREVITEGQYVWAMDELTFSWNYLEIKGWGLSSWWICSLLFLQKKYGPPAAALNVLFHSDLSMLWHCLTV